MKDTVSLVLGGGGGAILGGYLANRGWEPTAVAAAMTAAGGIGAYTLGGNLRTASNGLAAAGAGQLALALMAQSAEKDAGENAGKPRQAGHLPPGAIEDAFERARRRLAMQGEDAERYSDPEDYAA